MSKSAYQLYGFLRLQINEKYIAICHICGKNVQNTTASQLKLHRSVCKNTEEAYVMNISEETVKNSELAVNSLEICQDVNFKNENNCEPVFVDENTSNLNEISIEHLMNYMTSEIPHLETTSTKQENNTQQATATKNSKTKSKKRCIDSPSNFKRQKLKSEINYLKCKTKYYAQETEKLNFERTFMLLKAKKLRLDIRKLKN